MSSTSPSDLLSSRPPELPLSDVRDAAVASSSDAVASDEDQLAELTIAEQLRCPTALGYYISAGIHLVTYAVVAAVFALYATTMIDDADVAPIRASLDDEDRADTLVKFEEVGEIELGKASRQDSAQQLSNLMQESDKSKDASLLQDTLPSTEAVAADGAGGESDDDSFKFRVPKSGLAVTKGSFTAWTVPEFPEPGGRYRIIIQMKLPDSITSYRVSDLTGSVIGSDGYRQFIPYDRNKKQSVSYTNEEKKEVIIKSRNERIKVRNNKIQFVVVVPGAARLVQDTIKLKSRRLREDHELTLVFGSRPSDEGDK